MAVWMRDYDGGDLKMQHRYFLFGVFCLGGLLLSTCAASRAWAQLSDAPVRDSDRIIRKYVVSWKDLKKQYVVMQQNDFSCGAAALATLLTYYWGDDISEQDVLTRVERMLKNDEIKDRILHGLTMTDLRRVADRMGYEAVAWVNSACKDCLNPRCP
jgi:hypothetical protein